MSGEVWPVTVNPSDSAKSIDNLTTSGFFNNSTSPWNYPHLVNLTNSSFTNTSQTTNSWLSAFNTLYVANMYGYYIYFIIVAVVSFVIFMKSGPTNAGLALVLMSLLVFAPNVGNGNIPTGIASVFYGMIILGIASIYVGMVKQ
jgi:hypothetical protein